METRNFNVNGSEYAFQCKANKTRNGFSHTAIFTFNGEDIKYIARYYNRTWERERYDTAILLCAEKVSKKYKHLAADMDDLVNLLK